MMMMIISNYDIRYMFVNSSTGQRVFRLWLNSNTEVGPFRVLYFQSTRPSTSGHHCVYFRVVLRTVCTWCLVATLTSEAGLFILCWGREATWTAV